jgi:hypothetical protein
MQQQEQWAEAQQQADPELLAGPAVAHQTVSGTVRTDEITRVANNLYRFLVASKD